MTETEFEQGFVTLNELAESEYRESLSELLSESRTGTGDPAFKIARLVGVVLKKPFAVPRDLDYPSGHSRAYRTWELVDAAAFQEPSRRNCWQFEALNYCANEHRQGVYALALNAHHERGFFSYVLGSTTKYICGDVKIRREIRKAVDEAKKSGININATSPGSLIVGSAGFGLGIMLIQSAPILGIVGAPVIAGLVLILYHIGIDAFCDWTREDNINAPLERTGG